MPIFDAFLCMAYQITSLVDGKPLKNVDLCCSVHHSIFIPYTQNCPEAGVEMQT